jgi:glucose-1-phosphate cytidylyltransferase
MKYYAHFGHKDFILCLGYQGSVIKRFFLDYEETASNDFVMSGGGKVDLLGSDIADWKITFVDTGLASPVGERLRRVREHVQDEEMFFVNYTDGLSDLHLPLLEDHVRASGAVAGFITVRPPYSFHVVDADPWGTVRAVNDMAQANLRINGGFFACRPEILDYIEEGEELMTAPLQRLMARGLLTSLPHDGFWMSMDTFKEKQRLDEMYARGQHPWALWKREVGARVLAQEGARPF